jgi:type IV pilus assembly protein PilC
MFPSATLPLQSLIETCRRLRHSLAAGLLLGDVFRQLGERGPGPVRPAAARIADVLRRGGSLEDALRREPAFPPLFVSLATVGERTGHLPEVLAELEKFFELQLQLRRRFLAQVTWPAFQFVAAVFVVAALLWVVGFVARMSGGLPLDPLGLGLTGGGGALLFLFLVFGSLGALAGAYLLAARSLRHRAAADALLLRVPALGPCLQAFALARFSLGLRLTLEAGMPIADALALALEATGNAAFAEAAPAVTDVVRRGDELVTALATDGLFPEEYREAIAVGEQSGRLPQVLHKQAEVYDEEAGRRLAILAGTASYAVWIAVGAFIILLIFRIFSSYLNVLNQFNP